MQYWKLNPPQDFFFVFWYVRADFGGTGDLRCEHLQLNRLWIIHKIVELRNSFWISDGPVHQKFPACQTLLTFCSTVHTAVMFTVRSILNVSLRSSSTDVHITVPLLKTQVSDSSLYFKPAVDQNTVSPTSPAPRISDFPVPAFLVNSTSFPPCSLAVGYCGRRN